jgi:hypothetical protein
MMKIKSPRAMINDIPRTWKTQRAGKRTNGQKRRKFEKWRLRRKGANWQNYGKKGRNLKNGGYDKGANWQ